MQGPALLPPELADYQSFQTEEQLWDTLIHKPDDLATFFEVACADENWFQEHSRLMRALFRWGAKAYYLGQLPLLCAQRMVKTVQCHYPLLKPFLYFQSALFFNVKLSIEEQAVYVNSLMFGGCSTYFTELFKVHCFSKLRNHWTLPSISLSRFRLVEEHILKGAIQDLKRHPFSEVLSLMHQAQAWDLPELVKECTVALQQPLI